MKTAETLTTDEMIRRNGELGIAFTQQLIADESITLPANATLVLLPRDDPTLVEVNIAIGLAAIRRGEDVYFRYITESPDKPPSPQAGHESP